MKALISRLALKLRQLPPAAILALGLAYVFVLGMVDRHTPLGMSFTLFYLAGIAVVAWGAGRWPATVVAAAATAMILYVELSLFRKTMLWWVIVWNQLTRFLLFAAGGWVAAEAARLTSQLGSLVEQRTAQWKAEAEQHQATAVRLTEALAKSEQQEKLHRTVLATAMDGFFMLSPESRLTEANEAFCRMTGYTRNEAIQMSVADLEAQDKPADIARRIEKIRSQGFDRFETRDRCKDGRIIDLEISLSWLPHPDQGMFGFARDITKRKRAEAALRESEGRFRAVFDSSSDCILVWDREYNYLYANQAAIDHVGTRPDRVIGKNIRDGLGHVPDFMKLWMGRVDRAFATGESFRVEDAVPVGDRVVHSESQVSPIRNAAGEMFAVSVVYRDITARKQAEEALRLSRQQLAEAMELARLANWEYDVATGLFTFDDQFFALYATAADREGGNQMSAAEYASKFLFPEDAHLVHERIAQALASADPELSTQLEHRIRRRDGEIRHVLVRATALRDASGRSVKFRGANQDITERRLAEQRLAEALEFNRTLIAASAVGIAAFKADGECVLANEALAQIVGGSLLHKNFQHLESWRRAGLLQAAQEVLRTREPRQFELRTTTHFGKEVFILVHLASFISNGELHLLLVVSDLTERMRAQEALRLQALILQNMDEGALLLSPDMMIHFANPALEAAFGYEPGALNGQPVALLNDWPAEETARFNAEVGRVAETHGVWVGQYQNRRKDGTRFISEARISTVRIRGEAHFVCVQQDVTERTQAEQRLAEALDLNQKILATSTVGIAVYKASGQCIFANEALARILGGTVAKVMQQSFRQLESWKQSGLLSQAEEALQQGQSRTGEFFGKSRFGNTHWLHIHIAPFASGGAPHLLTMAYDITERKRAELLLKAQRDTGVSLSLTSDLKTALENLLQISVKLEGIDCGGAYLLDESTGSLDLVTSRGISSAFAESAAHIAPDAPQAWLIREGKPVFMAFGSMPFAPGEPRVRENLRASALLPLCHQGGVLGALTFGSHVQHEIPSQTQVLLEAVAAQAAGAIARIRAETARSRLERQLLEIADREQARIGQDLHDGLCQQLVSLAFDANSLERQLSEHQRPETAIAARIAHYLDQAITETRRLSRGLFPIRLETDGLPSALEELARATQDRFQVECAFYCTHAVQVRDKTIATHLYRIAQEAVSNAIKHARPNLITIHLVNGSGGLELRVEDNGTGPHPDSASSRSAGMGLHIMDYRARSIGGRLHIAPGPKAGTVISCCVPA